MPLLFKKYIGANAHLQALHWSFSRGWVKLGLNWYKLVGESQLVFGGAILINMHLISIDIHCKQLTLVQNLMIYLGG